MQALSRHVACCYGATLLFTPLRHVVDIFQRYDYATPHAATLPFILLLPMLDARH